MALPLKTVLIDKPVIQGFKPRTCHSNLCFRRKMSDKSGLLVITKLLSPNVL